MNWQSGGREPHILPGPHFRSSLPKVQLEIVRGLARNLVRDVAGPVYLIGAAHDCDLVLGDPQFPEVFAYLFVTEHGVSLRHLGAGPTLAVNDRVMQATPLFEGDVLCMEQYEFLIRIDWEGGARPHHLQRESTNESVADDAINQVNELLCAVRGLLEPPARRGRSALQVERPKESADGGPRAYRATG